MLPRFTVYTRATLRPTVTMPSYLVRVIERSTDRQRLEQALGRSPIVLVVGARQVGKSTLTRQIAQGRRATMLDLENHDTRPG